MWYSAVKGFILFKEYCQCVTQYQFTVGMGACLIVITRVTLFLYIVSLQCITFNNMSHFLCNVLHNNTSHIVSLHCLKPASSFSPCSQFTSAVYSYLSSSSSLLTRQMIITKDNFLGDTSLFLFSICVASHQHNRCLNS